MPACPDSLVKQAPELPPLLVQLLYNRGISNPSDFEAFLSASPSLCNDPFLLPDMSQAVSRIFRALLRGEKIAVFGDFDADGVTATVIMVEGLEALGGDVIAYLPHRSEEGHGLNMTALAEFREAGVSLVITVDCGISSGGAVSHAAELAMDVIVTDHHTLSGPMPAAVAVVNPKRPDSRYPFPHLAGVGVAFKLIEALTSGGHASTVEDFLSLVALGTIADMSPLTGENRYLVKKGIQVMCSSGRPGILALLKKSGLSADRLSSGSIAWDLAPRLNAAGRIDHARIGYALLHTRTNEDAEHMAEVLDVVNKERQSLLEIHWNRARQKVLSATGDRHILLVGDPDFPPGVCGLVASRLVDEFRRPAIVMQTLGSTARGSCRSLPEFDIIAALNRCSELFTQYGGHPAAAGFSMSLSNMDSLSQRLATDAEEKLAGLDLSPQLVADAEATPSMLTGDTFKSVQRLAPFGQGNRQPLFIARQVEVLESRAVGGGGRHLKMKVRSGGTTWAAIAFDCGSQAKSLPRTMDIIYSSQLNRWNGTESLELNITDFRPSVP
ncbi:MAG: single-stranded-DNA-specific exonuclease RecJ [Dehalococcoidia bacterium]|nr:single-stranded-DNA-specific exonuclease RecJ [Dehalococcoidia bacterium]